MTGECQGYGALIALEPRYERAFVASESCAQLLGIPPNDLLNVPLCSVLGSETLHALRNAAALPLFSDQPMELGRFEIAARMFDVSALRSDKLCVLEIEPASEGVHSLTADKALAAIEYITRVIEAADSTQRLLNEVSGYCRYLSGYSNVSVRPLANGLDARLPTLPLEGDIKDYAPIVYSVEDANVPLIRLDGNSEQLNLSCSYTRAVSAADRRLAAESGAIALMNIPLRIEGQGWGLLSFESPAPRRPSPNLRQLLACITPSLCRKLGALESDYTRTES